MWIELIAGPQTGWTGGATPTGSLNFAFGGSRTDTIATPGPGTATQVGAFFAGGGVIGARDVVTMWAGANNVFQGIPVAAATPATAQATMQGIATTAATDVIGQVNTLAAAGARTIVVLNLPDIGLAPSFIGGPAQALASFSSLTFNTTLATGLATVAANNPNARILQVNSTALLGLVTANPGAFGFANVTNQCLTTVACVTGSAATQNTYLFWDGVHPTAAGHRFIAAAVQQYLNAGTHALAAASITEIGVSNRRTNAYRALEQMGNFKPQADKTDIYISLIGEQASIAGRGAMPGYSFAQGGFEFGVIRHVSATTSLGFAFSTQTGEASTTVLGNKTTYSPTSFALDFMARWTNGQAFVQGVAGASINRISEFKRVLGIGNAENTASTTGRSLGFVVQAGYNLGMGSLTLTPSVKGGFVTTNTDSFRENGVVAPIYYNARTVSTFIAAAEVKASMKVNETTSAHAVLGYEAFFGQTGSQLKGRLADSPGSNFTSNAGRIQSPGFVFGAGVSGQIMAFPVTAEYRGAISADGKLQHRGSISARIGF